MKRKDYEKPTMQVVKLQRRYGILLSSEKSNAAINAIYTEETW